MNILQKQLLLDNKSLADLPDLTGTYRSYGPRFAPQKITIEEFEKLNKKSKKHCNRSKGSNPTLAIK